MNPNEELFHEAKQNLSTAIIGFTGRYFWLSNDYPARVEFEGAFYPSVTHAFLAVGVNDSGARSRIAATKDVAEARAIANAAAHGSAMPGLEHIDTLAELLMQKFEKGELKAKLLATGDAKLVYKNERGDTLWGVCNNRGFNTLGQTLMAVRDRLRELDARQYSHEGK